MDWGPCSAMAARIFWTMVSMASSQEMRSKVAPGPLGPTRFTGKRSRSGA